jgi:hypothetical protein
MSRKLALFVIFILLSIFLLYNSFFVLNYFLSHGATDSIFNNSIENAVIAEFSYDDWLVLGVQPWSHIEDFEKKFGKFDNGWITDDSFDGSFQYDTSSDFLSVAFGMSFGGTESNLRSSYTYVGVRESTNRVALPRGIGVGISLDDLLRIYCLEEKDENGYFYGAENTYPLALHAPNERGDYLLSFQFELEPFDNELRRSYTLRYNLTDDVITSISATARAYVLHESS